MPRSEILYGPYNMRIFGEYVYSPAETDYQSLQIYCNVGYEVWPYPDFWDPIPEAVVWHPSRADAPAKFRVPDVNGKIAASLYFPGDGSLAFNANYFWGDYQIQCLFHELGHRFYYKENIGPAKDDAGQMFWNFAKANGLTDEELFASGIRDVLLARLRLPPVKPVVPGLSLLMDAIQLARTT